MQSAPWPVTTIFRPRHSSSTARKVATTSERLWLSRNRSEKTVVPERVRLRKISDAFSSTGYGYRATMPSSWADRGGSVSALRFRSSLFSAWGKSVGKC